MRRSKTMQQITSYTGLTKGQRPIKIRPNTQAAVFHYLEERQHPETYTVHVWLARLPITMDGKAFLTYYRQKWAAVPQIPVDIPCRISYTHFS